MFEELDVSWMKEEDRLENIGELLKPENVETITICFVYIDCENAIKKVIYEKEILNGSHSISEDRITQLIQQYRVSEGVKHKLVDIVSYVVSCDSDVAFSGEYPTSVQTHKIFNPIVVEDSLFIFQNIHCVYFLFYEKCKKSEGSSTSIAHSILKKQNSPSGTKKRVHFDETKNSSFSGNRTTRKNRTN